MDEVTTLQMPVENAKILLQFLELAPIARGTKTHMVIEGVILNLKIALPKEGPEHGAHPDT